MSSDPTGKPGVPGLGHGEAERYPSLGTKGVSVSSSATADVPVLASRIEGWVVAIGLLVAGCVSMGIYLIVLHR